MANISSAFVWGLSKCDDRKVVITKILNGYIVESYYKDQVITTHHDNWLSIIKHFEGVYGDVERLLLKEREEKDKK